MKTLDKYATETFRKLVCNVHAVGDYTIIDDADDVFMPVHIEILRRNDHGRMINIAHFRDPSGKKQCDPLMTFIDTDNSIIPTFYRNDILDVTHIGVLAYDGDQIRVNEQLQCLLRVIANHWLYNIKRQQYL